MARCNVCRDKKLTDEQLLVLKNLNTNLADQWSDTTDKPNKNDTPCRYPKAEPMPPNVKTAGPGEMVNNTTAKANGSI